MRVVWSCNRHWRRTVFSYCTTIRAIGGGASMSAGGADMRSAPLPILQQNGSQVVWSTATATRILLTVSVLLILTCLSLSIGRPPIQECTGLRQRGSALSGRHQPKRQGREHYLPVPSHAQACWTPHRTLWLGVGLSCVSNRWVQTVIAERLSMPCAGRTADS